MTDAFKLCSLLVLSQALTAVLKKYEDNRKLEMVAAGLRGEKMFKVSRFFCERGDNGALEGSGTFFLKCSMVL